MGASGCHDGPCGRFEAKFGLNACPLHHPGEASRERAALCLRISGGLSWNNPARLQLLELAERLERQAKELELQNHPAEKVA